MQFAEVAAQLPEDVLEDMMLVEAVAGEGDNRGMPGQMPGFAADFLDQGEFRPWSRCNRVEMMRNQLTRTRTKMKRTKTKKT